MTERFRFTVTLFPDVAGAKLTTRKVDLGELRKLALATTADTKKKLPLVKLAVFGDKRTEQNSLRHNANVESVTGAEGDYDAEVVPFDRAVELVRQSGLNALLYTSPSNTPDKPRWRILCPSSRSLPPDERVKLVARVNGVLGGVLAGQSFTLSQAYYFGHINGGSDYRIEVINGSDFIDLRAVLDAGAIFKKRESTANAAGDSATNNSSKAQSDKQADPDLIFAAMAVIPNDEVDWVAWNAMGMACYLATDGAERGFEAFDIWSRKSPAYDKGDTTQRRWERYRTSPPTQIGAGTIFMKADQAQPGWRVLKGLSIDAIDELLRLSRLARLQYELERKEVAERLDIRVTALDDVVAHLRPLPDSGDKDDLQGGRITFEDVEPWADAVDGERLIADMVKAIRDYVILSEEQALACVLWEMHPHVLEIAEHTPRLQIKSPAPRCGKSTLLSVIAAMVPKPLQTENISMPALFRTIEKHRPTLLIDEADSFLKREDGKDREDMNGILNSGHKRGGSFIRTVGEDFEPRAFSTFAPLAFAWLVKRGVHVAQTLEDRSITIELRRRLPDEKILRFRSARAGHLREFARRAARWVADHKIALGAADPAMPDELNDRAQDNWRVMIAIADCVSADLGRKARAAAVKIAEENIGGDIADAVLLLADAAGIIRHKPAITKAGTVIGSEDLIAALAEMEARPWAEWSRGKPLSTHALAKLLKPFDLHPHRYRTGQGPTDLTRGYAIKAILEAAERYATEETDKEDIDPSY
jgi:putative DNA primase/helicase